MAQLLNIRADARAGLAFLAYYGVITPLSEPEQRLVSQLPLRGATVMDIGANVGIYTLQLSALVGDAGRVIAFEPYHRSAARLRRVVRMVGAANVEVVEKALTKAANFVSLSNPEPRLGGSDDAKVHVEGLHETNERAVRGAKLDSEAARLDLKSLELVKCDVEGSEYDVFVGGSETIRRYRPVVICEIEPRWVSRYGRDVVGSIDFLRALGDYRVAVWENGSLRDAKQALERHTNYIFLPERFQRSIV